MSIQQLSPELNCCCCCCRCRWARARIPRLSTLNIYNPSRPACLVSSITCECQVLFPLLRLPRSLERVNVVAHSMQRELLMHSLYVYSNFTSNESFPLRAIVEMCLIISFPPHPTQPNPLRTLFAKIFDRYSCVVSMWSWRHCPAE